jgi:hypothetical protein
LSKKTELAELRVAKVSAIVALVSAVLSAGGAFWSNKIAQNTYQAQFRPYIGIEIITNKKSKDKIESSVIIVNTGAVPANNLVLKGTQSLFYMGQVRGEKPFPAEHKGILLPLPAKTIYRFWLTGDIETILSYPDLKWVVDLKFRYDGVSSKEHETYLRLSYVIETNRFEYIDGYAK